MRDFGCCPGVRLWQLNFTRDYGWRFTCTDGSRSFLPLMVVNSNRDDMRPWMMALDFGDDFRSHDPALSFVTGNF